MITLDFETEKIIGNPIMQPPRPVGLAVQVEDQNPVYLTDLQEMYNAWNTSIHSHHALLFHNAPFDIEVGTKFLHGTRPPWHRIHDTMYPVFMMDPYAYTFSLKPSVDRYLLKAPETQDRLKEWILANIQGSTEKDFGGYIADAPVELVEPYAKDDVAGTYQLFQKLMPQINEEAYDRERRHMPILVKATQRGIRIDRTKLEEDIHKADANLFNVEQMIYQYLGREFNIGSPVQLADALDAVGAVNEWILTDKGNRSTAKDNLAICLSDKTIKSLLLYRSSLATCLGTFMKPWMRFSEADGRVHPEWNQVKHSEKGSKKGARTGRLSSNDPSFMNVPTEFDFEIIHPLPPLPMMREYCLPEEGHIWVKRDFSSQEIRIMAHYENGKLAQAYNENPDLDPHQMAMDIIEDNTSVIYPRKDVKIVAFMMVYGGGVNAIAAKTGRPKNEAYNIKSAYYEAFPGVKDLQKDITGVGRRGEYITTWGGRKYYKEPHNTYDFSYKLLNYLIQGSAADQTKQCVNDWYDTRDPEALFMVPVHDEINISVPKETASKHMLDLKDAMEQELFDVPMRSEGFTGPNWYDIKEYNDVT